MPKQKRPPTHQTVIIWDWDNTLLPSNFLNLRCAGDAPLPLNVQRVLTENARVAVQLLELSLQLGKTFIITNAMKGWVEYSQQKYLPLLKDTLSKVQVISARNDFEKEHPGNVFKWKIEAFLKVQRTMSSQAVTNLVSLGDSMIELDAVHVMGSNFEQALIKTVKFRENPSPEELVKQLELVFQKFFRIVTHARSLKIGLERK